MEKHPLNRTKEVSVNVVPSVDANTNYDRYSINNLMMSFSKRRCSSNFGSTLGSLVGSSSRPSWRLSPFLRYPNACFSCLT